MISTIDYSEDIMTSPMPLERFSDSANAKKRKRKEFGWSARERCRIEYMTRNDNAAKIGFSWRRDINAGRERDEIPTRLVGV